MRSYSGPVRKVRTLMALTGAALLGAAVVTELRKSAGQRTWEGSVGGIVPYDLRPPTADRVRERMWAPDDPTIFTPHVFGVGWSVNLGRIARRLGLV